MKILLTGMNDAQLREVVRGVTGRHTLICASNFDGLHRIAAKAMSVDFVLCGRFTSHDVVRAIQRKAPGVQVRTTRGRGGISALRALLDEVLTQSPPSPRA